MITLDDNPACLLQRYLAATER